MDVQKADDYYRSAYAAWRMSYEKLPSTATLFLQLCSYFHHSGITEHMFYEASKKIIELPWISQDTRQSMFSLFCDEQHKWDPLKFLNLVYSARSYSLLNFDRATTTYSIHPLVHAWIRSEAGGLTYIRVMALEVLASCIELRDEFMEYSESHDQSFESSLIIHSDAALECMLPESHEIATRLSSMYTEARVLKPAHTLAALALDICQRQVGLSHPLTLQSSLLFGLVLQFEGKAAESSEQMHRVISSAGDMPECTSLLLCCRHILAIDYRNQGDLNKAEVLLRQVTKESERHFGPDNLLHLQSMYWLGVVLTVDMGQHSEAEELLLQLLERYKLLQGLEHENTLDVTMMLGLCYANLGKWSEAEDLCRQIVGYWSHRLHPSHWRVLLAQNHLANVVSRQGKLEEAEYLRVRIVRGYEQIYDPPNENISAAKSNLAEIYLEQLRLSEAEKLLNEVITLQAFTWRQARSMYLLARVYYTQSRKREGITLMQEALDCMLENIGPDHQWSIEARKCLEKWKNEVLICKDNSNDSSLAEVTKSDLCHDKGFKDKPHSKS